MSRISRSCGDEHQARVDLRKTHPDRAIAALAARQRGVVSHGGVYLVGQSAPMPRARETAALLSCGSDAVLSHRSAASIWGFIKPWRGSVDVTVVGRDCGPRAGVALRRLVRLDSKDVRRCEGLRVTAPVRTLFDVASLVGERELERAVNEALVLRLTTHMLWRSAQLVVEIDGYAYHSSRAAFERDRARDADLQTRGLRILRFTWRQIVEQPEIVVARLGQLLKR